MDPQKRKNSLLGIDVGSVTHMIFVGGEWRSVLESFTHAEVSQMMNWLAMQQSREDDVSMSAWPGWQFVAERIQTDVGRLAKSPSASCTACSELRPSTTENRYDD